MVPLEMEMPLLELEIPWAEFARDGEQEVTGGPSEQTTGPMIEKPFKSIETLSAEMVIGAVLASGTVKFPDNR